MKVTQANEIKPNIAQYLDTNGDGTGNIDAIGDYSLTPTEFYIQPPAGSVYELRRVIVTIEDTGSIDSGGYGNNSSPLTNGISVECRIEGQPVRTLTAQLPVTRTADWNSLCFDGDVINFGSGNQFYVARWTFTNDGDPIRLTENDVLAFKFNDNLTSQGLVGHRFLIKGKIIEG